MSKKLALRGASRKQLDEASAWLEKHAKLLPAEDVRGGRLDPSAERQRRQERDREREPYRARARTVKRARVKRLPNGGIELALPPGWQRRDPPRPPPPASDEWPAADYRAMAHVVMSYAQAALEAKGHVNPADYGDLRAMYAALMGEGYLPENQWKGQLRGMMAWALMARLGDPRPWTRESGMTGEAILKSLRRVVQLRASEAGPANELSRRSPKLRLRNEAGEESLTGNGPSAT